jgi:hypothetical protein
MTAVTETLEILHLVLATITLGDDVVSVSRRIPSALATDRIA